MPPKNHKKAIANARAPTQGRVGQRKNAAEVITDSGDEFEHLTVDAEDRYVQSSSSCLILRYLCFYFP